MHQNTKEDLEARSEKFDDHPCVVTIRKGIAATESKSFKQPIMDYDPNGNVTTDYKVAVKKMLDMIKGDK